MSGSEDKRRPYFYSNVSLIVLFLLKFRQMPTWISHRKLNSTYLKLTFESLLLQKKIVQFKFFTSAKW